MSYKHSLYNVRQRAQLKKGTLYSREILSKASTYLIHTLKFGGILKSTGMFQLPNHWRLRLITCGLMRHQTGGQHLAVEFLKYILVLQIFEHDHLDESHSRTCIIYYLNPPILLVLPAQSTENLRLGWECLPALDPQDFCLISEVGRRSSELRALGTFVYYFQQFCQEGIKPECSTGTYAVCR